MRLPVVSCFLLAALPVLAQGAEGHWYLDVHGFTPSLTGDIQGSSNGNAFNVDLKNDLDLVKDKAKPGYSLEYQGTRFGLELSWDQQNYKGNNTLQNSISINGVNYSAATQVVSTMKTSVSTLNWTIRYCKWPQFWLGLDLGGRATRVQLDATGTAPVTHAQTSVSYSATLPTPQVGPSLGFTACDGRVVGRAMYHLLQDKGATYGHGGADLRYFPLSWLGLRAFGDVERYRVPRNSIKDDLDLTLDRGGFGLGLVARF
jgi:hypothetical protein